MKLTRKSYKRKIVTFGVMLVLAISLISTGFAAWIISQGSTKDAEGQVEVGVVTDKSVEISDLKFYADCYNPGVDNNKEQTNFVTFDQLSEKPLRFSFDPVYGDVTGRVKFDEEAYKKQLDGQKTGFEALSIRVTGKVSNARMLDKITLDLGVSAGVKAAADKGFIVLPTYSYTDPKSLTSYDLVESEMNKEHLNDLTNEYITFDFTVSITWGEKFNKMNPSEYFDAETFPGDPDPVPNPAFKYELKEVQAALEEIRGTIHEATKLQEQLDFGGRKYDAFDPDSLANKQGPKFKLTITAKAK